jgi:hypothetical protein
MIKVSVAPDALIAQRTSPVAIQFANIGRGPCSNIVFKLALPVGVALMGGSDRVQIPIISAGRTHTHQVTVKASRPGPFALTSSNFSYRDEFDNPVRVNDFRANLTVAPALPAMQVKQPAGRLGVACEEGELPLGEWDQLRILVTNRTGVALKDVTVAVDGAFTVADNRPRIGVLAVGATARFLFRVKATQGGRHVPVAVHTTYSHPGPSGAAQHRTQEDHLSMVVRSGKQETQPLATPQTILYLAASPQDRAPLRSDVEMREVQERLRLGNLRDRYQLAFRPAARFHDISQALMDVQPHVVHFSGHGDRDGYLAAEDRNGDSALIAPEGLAGLFGRHRSTLRCVVLNACYSVRLAREVAAQIDYVIGMRDGIEDDAAIEFSLGFYIGLFGGAEVPDAFARGEDHLRSSPDFAQNHLTPVLFPPGEGG